MTEQEALQFIHSLRGRGKKMGLTKITELLHRLGDPQDRLRFVHVAGTNGKGSTTAMTAGVLRAAGYRTGMFISPFIIDFRERMQINGEMIPPEELGRCAALVKAEADAMDAAGRCPTEFEVVTATAMVWFEQCRCDIVVLECGIGGREDSTNVIQTALVDVLCSISLDHTDVLGDTVAQIAREKCGILRAGVPCICYPKQAPEALEVIREEAQRVGAPLSMGTPDAVTVLETGIEGSHIRYGDLELHIPLMGAHQICNCLNAVEALFALRRQGWVIPDTAIAAGIAATRFPARLECFSKAPLVIVDGAHNEMGAQVLAEALTLVQGRPITAIVGMLGDKDAAHSLAKVLPLCQRVFTVTPPHNTRALPAEALAELARPLCPAVTACDTLTAAMAAAYDSTPPNGVLLIFGSLYLASDMRGIASRFLASRSLDKIPH